MTSPYPKLIDVSTYQDNSQTPQRIDWSKPKQHGIKGVVNRALFVATKDEDFDYNWYEQKRQGYIRSAYGFWGYWNGCPDVSIQARAFVNILKPDPGEFPIAWLDIEKANDNYPVLPARSISLPSIERYMKTFEDGIGIEMGMYTNIAGLAVLAPIPNWLMDKYLWIAWPLFPSTGETVDQFVSRTGVTPPISKYWSKPWLLWQNTWKGPGYDMGMESAGLDMDYFNGTEKDLNNFVFGTEIPEDPQDDEDEQNEEDTTGMYENNAIGIYLKSDYKVTDYDKLVDQVDVVFIRCAYVPLTHTYGGVKYNAPDYAKTDDDLLTEDLSYKTHYLKIRESAKRLNKHTKIIAVAEFNSAYDKDYEYKNDHQAQQIKRILNASGNYMPDAFCSQIMMDRWLEGTGVIEIGGYNMSRSMEYFFPTIIREMEGRTVFGWSQKKFLEQRDFYKFISIMLDNKNKGEPTWPFGFTYLPLSWKNVWKTTVETVRDAVKLVAPLSTNEVNDYLNYGSYTGFRAKNESGSAFNHGFWGLFGCYVSYILNSATNQPAMIEPIVFDTDWETFAKWMLWDVEIPEDPDDDDDDGNNENVDLSEYMKIVDFNVYKQAHEIEYNNLYNKYSELSNKILAISERLDKGHTHDINVDVVIGKVQQSKEV